MKKISYSERKTFVQYDEKHVVLYLNEEPAEITNEETGETVQGYSYTGSMEDGGTLIEAANVTDGNRRAKRHQRTRRGKGHLYGQPPPCKGASGRIAGTLNLKESAHGTYTKRDKGRNDQHVCKRTCGRFRV